jgi:hypothetical protein
VSAPDGGDYVPGSQVPATRLSIAVFALALVITGLVIAIKTDADDLPAPAYYCYDQPRFDGGEVSPNPCEETP